MSLRPRPSAREGAIGTANEAHVQSVIGAALAANVEFMRTVAPMPMRAPTPAKTAALEGEQLVFAMQGLGLSKATKPDEEDNEAYAQAKKLHDSVHKGMVLALDEYPGGLYQIKEYVNEVSSGQLESGFPIEHEELENAGALFTATWFHEIEQNSFWVPTYPSWVRELQKGGFNKTMTLDLKDGSDAPEWMRTMLRTDPLTDGPDVAVLRMAFYPPDSLMHLYRELMFMAYASRTKVGPRQHLAFVEPGTRQRFPEPANYKTEDAYHYVKRVWSIAEAFDGDCKRRDDSTNKLIAMGCQNYWPKVCETIFHAVTHGFVHGDLKRANMLYRLNPNDKNEIAEMRYTDFDPEFVCILDMSDPKIANLIPCIVWLTLFAYLAELRCMTSPDSTKEDSMGLQEVDNHIATAIKTMEKGVKFVEDKLTDHLTYLCDLDVIDTDPYSVAKDEIVKRLSHHMYLYATIRSDDPAKREDHNKRCMLDRPQPVKYSSGRPKRGKGAGMIDRLVKYVLKGQDAWAPSALSPGGTQF